MQAEVSSDASGRSFARIVNFQGGATRITSGELDEFFLAEDIQVKEGEALRLTLQMLLNEFPNEIKEKTSVCKIGN